VAPVKQIRITILTIKIYKLERVRNTDIFLFFNKRLSVLKSLRPPTIPTQALQSPIFLSPDSLWLETTYFYTKKINYGDGHSINATPYKPLRRLDFFLIT